MEHRQRDLLVVVRFARRRFGSYPNVLGVGFGTKFKRPSPTSAPPERIEGLTCLQFFVTRKRKTLQRRHRLPTFVYRRFLNGRVDRRRKIPTDVIPVGAIRTACGAGSHLCSNGDQGLITLIFRNKAETGHPFYLISCAHVVGDMRRSPPAYDALTGDRSRARPFARTIVNSTAGAGEIAYDIGLARIEDQSGRLRGLQVRGEPFILDSFLAPRSIQQGVGVSAVLRNHTTHGTVDSLDASASVVYGNRTYLVHNLFGLNVAAGRGDSGGLIHKATQAVGIVVAASSDGWLWFQPLQPAITFLNGISPVRIGVFNP